MRGCIHGFCLVLALSLFVRGTAHAQTPTLSLQAVEVNGVSITPSNSIFVKPGDTIVAELFVSEWTLDDERLLAFQAEVPRSSFNSGAAGLITPEGWEKPIIFEDNIDCGPGAPPCPAELPVCRLVNGEEGVCVGSNHDPAQGVFINSLRPDWVFFDSAGGVPFSSILATDVIGPSIRYAGALISPGAARTYASPPSYGGTLRLGVSADASGTFIFEIDRGKGSGTILLDANVDSIEPLTAIGLTIEIDPCGNGVMDAGEACDDGLSNSDTVPDACRDDCALPSCGDNVKDSDEKCDGKDLGDCPGSCAGDCSCLPVTIPTVSAWGLAVLTLSLLAVGRVYFGRRFTRRFVS